MKGGSEYLLRVRVSSFPLIITRSSQFNLFYHKEVLMGLFDDILGKVTGAAGGGQSDVMNAVVGLISSKEHGGLAGLVEGFTKGGLGDLVSSWVGTGQNLPATADQIAKGLGATKLGAIASQLGVTPEQASSTLSKVLPDIVDKLTPNGKLPTGDLLQQGLSLLKGKL
jgi:uncharacterized protein YidB (DUF937 family)